MSRGTTKIVKKLHWIRKFHQRQLPHPCFTWLRHWSWSVLTSRVRVQQTKWWIWNFFIQIRLFRVNRYHFVSHFKKKMNKKFQRFEGDGESFYLKFVAYILSNGYMRYERHFRVICPLLEDMCIQLINYSKFWMKLWFMGNPNKLNITWWICLSNKRGYLVFFPTYK